MDILTRYGQAVRKIRLERGISQEELADRCGLHRTYISDIELGKRNLSLENIERIAISLNKTLPEFFKEVE
ncbi:MULTISPECIES: helix-turn-helix domain-containing protein [Bacteria]|jgi:transcriptional regulator with XRE-family HTH domain|uniref:helix-turn-helix domain-containing protein n=1 Tax=Bacteria TaxID=2 RepID=UPI002170F31D|nr:MULTISPECIES: helix-turn-helix transcriptional regulator [Bacteria]MCI9649216.1 helix-turn-helix transcriptional regulator [Oscillibacter sp.]